MSSSYTDLNKDSAHGLGYRPDIDGLRAVAVLSVLFYHAGLPPFFGGFVGVDIFFVISGYLITGIILADIAKGRFTIAQFYERRIRRIFPALYLTVAVTIAAALLLFSATDLERLFTSIVWQAFFASNFYFAEDVGYFDAAAEQSAILHTWSLAIEEQFYVFFPPLVAALSRWKRVPIRWVLLVLAVVSFVFSVYVVDRDDRAAFFSTPARIWELMLGALVAVGLFPRSQGPWLRAAAAAIGAVLIAGSFVLLSTDTPFPGAYALPACAGTAAIIWAGESGPSTVTRLLSLRPVVFVGLISYSLYLLHWPMLVMLRYWNEGELSAAQTALALAAAGAAAWLSWRYVEQPFRTPTRRVGRRTLFALALSLMLALGLGGFVGSRWQEGRFSDIDKVIQAEEVRARKEQCLIADLQTFDDWKARGCSFDGIGRRFAVWGDSFAAHYFEAFRKLASQNRRPMTLLARGSCPPIARLSIPNRPGCEEFNERALALLLMQRPELVIISADWIIYEKKKTVAELVTDKFMLLEETIRTLRKNGSRVMVIGPSPVFPTPIARIAADASPDAATTKASYSRKFDKFFRGLEENGTVEYFPTYTAFCDASVYCRYREGDALLFWDTGHLTESGGTRVVGRLAKQFPELLINDTKFK